MKKWFISLNGALTLSIIALLTELWRGFLDASLVIAVEMSDFVELFAIIFTLLMAVWSWAIFQAFLGKRAGVITAFVINFIVLFGIPISWLFFYCPSVCRETAGIFNLANTLNLIFGSLAAISLGFQLRSNEKLN